MPKKRKVTKRRKMRDGGVRTVARTQRIIHEPTIRHRIVRHHAPGIWLGILGIATAVMIFYLSIRLCTGVPFLFGLFDICTIGLVMLLFGGVFAIVWSSKNHWHRVGHMDLIVLVAILAVATLLSRLSPAEERDIATIITLAVLLAVWWLSFKRRHRL